MKKHLYSCTVSMGNISISETEEQKKNFSKFMESFHIKDYVIKKNYWNSKQDSVFSALI